jgi:hypothetical protein
VHNNLPAFGTIARFRNPPERLFLTRRWDDVLSDPFRPEFEVREGTIIHALPFPDDTWKALIEVKGDFGQVWTWAHDWELLVEEPPCIVCGAPIHWTGTGHEDGCMIAS